MLGFESTVYIDSREMGYGTGYWGHSLERMEYMVSKAPGYRARGT